MSEASVNLKTLPDPDVMVSNIISELDRASAKDLAQGLAWYDEALELARNLAAGTIYTVEPIVGIIAVISAQMSWEVNRVLPRHIIDQHIQGIPPEEWTGASGKAGIPLSMRQRQACKAILEGADPRDFLGPKTGAFFANILGCKNTVTVDRWAIRAATNDPKLVTATRAAMKRISEAYTEAAKMKMMDPRSTQAAVWVSYRNNARG